MRRIVHKRKNEVWGMKQKWNTLTWVELSWAELKRKWTVFDVESAGAVIGLHRQQWMANCKESEIKSKLFNGTFLLFYFPSTSMRKFFSPHFIRQFHISQSKCRRRVSKAQENNHDKLCIKCNKLHQMKLQHIVDHFWTFPFDLNDQMCSRIVCFAWLSPEHHSNHSHFFRQYISFRSVWMLLDARVSFICIWQHH